MKYTIEAVDDKVIETLEVQGNKFTATWEEVVEDDRPYRLYRTVGKSLDTQIQEAFKYNEELAMDVENLVDITLFPNKFFDFVEAWGE